VRRAGHASPAGVEEARWRAEVTESPSLRRPHLMPLEQARKDGELALDCPATLIVAPAV